METTVEYLIIPPDGKFEHTPEQAKMIREAYENVAGIDALNIKFHEIYSVEAAAKNNKSCNNAIGNGAFVNVT